MLISQAGFFWFGTCFLSLLYTFFRIPETRNRSFLGTLFLPYNESVSDPPELDYLFHEKVKARAFRTYPIDSKYPHHPWRTRITEFQCPSLPRPTKRISTETLTTRRRTSPRSKYPSSQRLLSAPDMCLITILLELQVPQIFEVRDK